MKTIGHEELKQMLDRKAPIRLVMALGEWAYQAKHIPGSIHFATSREALQLLNKEDEIVVYCSDENCIASRTLGQFLEATAIRMSCTLRVVSRSWSRRVIP